MATIFKTLSFLFMKYFKYHFLFLVQNFFEFCLTRKMIQFGNNICEKVINNCSSNSKTIYNFIVFLTMRYFISQFIVQNIKRLNVLIIYWTISRFNGIVHLKVLSICLRTVTIFKTLVFLVLWNILNIISYF